METTSYIESIYNQTNYIDRSYIEIHNKPNDDIPFNIFEDSSDKFGTLTIKMAKKEITTTPIFILLSIDITNSMDSIVKIVSRNEKISKMDYMIKTCKNMIEYLSNQPVDIYITVHAFNTNVIVIVENEKITTETKNSIIEKFEYLKPNGSTDIGLALTESQSALVKYREQNPTHKISHIFMTDGEPNAGILNGSILESLINKDFNNVFVGFGKDHNSTLLRKLSENGKSEYHVVIDEENTGLVYADTIYQLLFSAIENITITMNDGLIYNWKTNTWSNYLELNVFVSETEKTFHIRTHNPSNVSALINGVISDQYIVEQLLDEVVPLPDLLETDGEQHMHTDLSKFIFRQKVQEILFELSRSSIKRPRIQKRLDTLEDRKNLRTFFAKMREFMRNKGLLTDPFMLLLCDDILVVYNSLHTCESSMYLSARQISQGTQQSYTSPCYNRRQSQRFDSDGDSDDDSNAETIIVNRNYSQDRSSIRIPRLLRRDSMEIETILDEEEERDETEENEDIIKKEDDINYYTTNNEAITCYATENMTKTMKLFT